MTERVFGVCQLSQTVEDPERGLFVQTLKGFQGRIGELNAPAFFGHQLKRRFSFAGIPAMKPEYSCTNPEWP